MKELLFKWSENYAEVFRHTRLLSQLFSFCVAVALILGFITTSYNLFSYQYEISSEVWQNIVKELFLQIIVALLFAVRFSLLFLKNNAYFWLSQIVWLITYLILLTQLFSTGFGCTKNMFPIFEEIFSYIFVAYIFFSPLRQTITLLVSFIKIFSK